MVGGLPKVRWATWIPHGSWKDVFIGDYDYKYLFMVSFREHGEAQVLLQESGAIQPLLCASRVYIVLTNIGQFYPVAHFLSLPCFACSPSGLTAERIPQTGCHHFLLSMSRCQFCWLQSWACSMLWP